MPLYEYHCAACDRQVELLIRSSGETPVCPHCGGEKLQRLLSVVAAHTAPSSSSPACGPSPRPGGGCGLPQCGQGGCGML